MSQERSVAAPIIAKELQVAVERVEAAIRLLDEGATVPFIARYRKELTGGLDDIALRHIAERLVYLRELEERKATIIASINEQAKMTPVLLAAIEAADTKNKLEDIYLPYKPKRHTKAQIAREAGLEPLAMVLWQSPDAMPEEAALNYVQAAGDFDDASKVLLGAREILMEHFAEHAPLLDHLREALWEHMILSASFKSEKKEDRQKYADYGQYQEPIAKIPSHRALALFRGRRDGVLAINLSLPESIVLGEADIAKYHEIQWQGRPGEAWLKDTIRLCWKAKILTKIELELLARLRESADEEAIHVFSRNLKALLLASPAGAKRTIGLDPGIRTGVKVVVLDETGKLVDYSTIYPLAPQNDWHGSIAELAKLASKHQVQLVSIGNGTGSRETERLVAELMQMYPDLKLTKVVVNEAGASVYSASELASIEFPDLDVSLRGAVSIGRRLQDPLAELVKIEPKSIGVGQYQHDVNQSKLSRCLDGVVEDCVNAVGVDLNHASPSLLTKVAGFNAALAKNVVKYREQHGAFHSRQALLMVPKLGNKTFEQAAGFLRIIGGANPLDASAVHPEAYALVERMAKDSAVDVGSLIGNSALLKQIKPEQYVCEQFGLATIKDVLAELEKPGRDPRGEFKTVQFKEGVTEIKHLEIGMVLEGVVSNITNFGAFVDVGVHQDGLVHISALANRFVKDPHQILKPGQIVTVKVVELDRERKRIGLSMRLEDNKETQKAPAKVKAKPVDARSKPQVSKAAPAPKPAAKPKTVFNSAMADAFAKLKQGKQ